MRGLDPSPSRERSWSWSCAPRTVSATHSHQGGPSSFVTGSRMKTGQRSWPDVRPKFGRCEAYQVSRVSGGYDSGCVQAECLCRQNYVCVNGRVRRRWLSGATSLRPQASSQPHCGGRQRQIFKLGSELVEINQSVLAAHAKESAANLVISYLRHNHPLASRNQIGKPLAARCRVRRIPGMTQDAQGCGVEHNRPAHGFVPSSGMRG